MSQPEVLSVELRPRLLGPILVIVLPQLILALGPTSTAGTGGISVRAFATPTQVLETQNFTVTVLVSNNGKLDASGVSTCLIAPGGWDFILRTSSPGKVTLVPNVCPQSGASLSSRSSMGYSIGSLQSNRTEFLSFEVHVPAGTPAGTYSVVLLATSALGDSQGLTTIQSEVPANLPFGGVLIPVSLALILLPGFLTIAIALWIIKALSSSWQTSIAIALLSFAFGYGEWSYLSHGWPSQVPLSSANILTLDLTTISLPDVGSVLLWSVGLGFLLGLIFYGTNFLRAKIEEFGGYLATRWQALRTGYIEDETPTWKFTLKTSFLDAVEAHGGNSVPQVRLAFLHSPASSEGSKVPSGSSATSPSASNPPTAINLPDKAKVGISETSNDDTVKVFLSRGSEKGRPDSTEGQKPSLSARGATTHVDEWVVNGLLAGYDSFPPFDVSVEPQKIINIRTDSPNWDDLKESLTKVIVESEKLQEPEESKKGDRFDYWQKAPIGDWAKKLNESRFPKSPDFLIQKIIDAGGTIETYDPNLHSSMAFDRRLIAGGANVDGTMWVKGAEILTLEVLTPKPLFLFNVV